MKIIKNYLTNNPCYKRNLRKTDSRDVAFQKNGPKGLMLHSVGTPQPSAKVFISKWNKPTYTRACVHGFIDGNDGTVYQTLPWNYRGWHAGMHPRTKKTANDSLIGVEMCEPSQIRYVSGSKFVCLDKAAAAASAKRTYQAAVELFAHLCKTYGLDPTKDGVIISHKEGHERGVASNHGDPEHLWRGLGLPYTMDIFRADVAKELKRINAPKPSKYTRYLVTAKDGVYVREEPSLSGKILGEIPYHKEVRAYDLTKTADGFVWMYCDKPTMGLKGWIKKRWLKKK